jgi:hypothetical protein
VASVPARYFSKTLFGSSAGAYRNGYAGLLEEIQGALAHASGDNRRYAALRQPRREEAGLMRRRNEHLQLPYRLAFDVEDGELFAVAEVHREDAFRNRIAYFMTAPFIFRR